MTTPVNKIYGYDMAMYVANGVVGNAVVWEKYALVNADRSFTVSGSQVEDPQIDLDDQSKPAVITRRGQSSDTGFSGGGMLHANTLVDATNWALNQDVRDCQFRFANTMTVTGKYILANLEIGAAREEAVNVTLSLVQAEKPTITPGS